MNEPKHRPSGALVRQLVAEQIRLMDLEGLVEVDEEALERLDEMSDEEAIAVIDQTMAAIMYS